MIAAAPADPGPFVTGRRMHVLWRGTGRPGEITAAITP
jgi:hypothetical protein